MLNTKSTVSHSAAPHHPNRPQRLVEVSGISVRRGDTTLLDNVSLSVQRGEIVTIVGPNGSGKSTTVKSILGIVKPQQGSIRVAPGTQIGYVPQQLEINWSMPLNVRRFMRLTRRYSHSQILEALSLTGVEHLIDREMTALSGGEFQRVLIARAMACHPDLLVLDEPVQGVDYNAEADIYQLIADLRETYQCGVLLVSHDLHIVMAQTDTVVCLNGHVCCSGPPQMVTNSAEFRTLFGAGGEQALAFYRHHHDHSHAPDGEIIPAESHPHDHHSG